METTDAWTRLWLMVLDDAALRLHKQGFHIAHVKALYPVGSTASWYRSNMPETLRIQVRLIKVFAAQLVVGGSLQRFASLMQDACGAVPNIAINTDMPWQTSYDRLTSGSVATLLTNRQPEILHEHDVWVTWFRDLCHGLADWLLCGDAATRDNSHGVDMTNLALAYMDVLAAAARREMRPAPSWALG